MSNLLIFYPDIPQAASRYITYQDFTGTMNENEDWPFYNMFRGARWQIHRSASNKTIHYLNYDLGPTQAKSIDFIAFSRADILAAARNFTYELYYSDDAVTYSYAGFFENLTSASLLGPYSSDYAVITSQNARRAWRFNIYDTPSGGLTSFALTMGKLYFGSAFNPAVELDDYELNRTYDSVAPFFTAGGSHLLGRSNLPRYVITTYWDGLTDTEISTFMNSIYKNRFTTTFFLYTQTYHDPLNGHRIIQVALQSAEVKKKYEKDGFNYLTAKWVEVLG